MAIIITPPALHFVRDVSPALTTGTAALIGPTRPFRAHTLPVTIYAVTAASMTAVRTGRAVLAEVTRSAFVAALTRPSRGADTLPGTLQAHVTSFVLAAAWTGCTILTVIAGSA